MSVFLGVTYELDCANTRSQNKLMGRTLDYFIDNLNNFSWQENISGGIRKISESQIAVMIYLRFFRQARVEENKLKSYAKYIKKDECLVIDPIFILEEYVFLNENEQREKLCNDILSYLEIVFAKYKERINDFNVMVFVPLLRERVEEIKCEKFPYREINELEELLDGILDENLNLIE